MDLKGKAYKHLELLTFGYGILYGLIHYLFLLKEYKTTYIVIDVAIPILVTLVLLLLKCHYRFPSKGFAYFTLLFLFTISLAEILNNMFRALMITYIDFQFLESIMTVPLVILSLILLVFGHKKGILKELILNSRILFYYLIPLVGAFYILLFSLIHDIIQKQPNTINYLSPYFQSINSLLIFLSPLVVLLLITPFLSQMKKNLLIQGSLYLVAAMTHLMTLIFYNRSLLIMLEGIAPWYLRQQFLIKDETILSLLLLVSVLSFYYSNNKQY